MKIKFNDEQLKLIAKVMNGFDASRDLTDDDLCNLEDEIGDYLVLTCSDGDGNPNEEGVICEQIIDLITDLEE